MFTHLYTCVSDNVQNVKHVDSSHTHYTMQWAALTEQFTKGAMQTWPHPLEQHSWPLSHGRSSEQLSTHIPIRPVVSGQASCGHLGQHSPSGVKGTAPPSQSGQAQPGRAQNLSPPSHMLQGRHSPTPLPPTGALTSRELTKTRMEWV